MTAKRRPRVGARQRREEVIEAALVEFSRKGLRGGSTIAIARRAGLSHAGLFRLFPTKKKLFLAVLTRVFEKIERELPAVEDIWAVPIARREPLLMLLQGYAASDEPDVRDLMHRATRALFERVEAMPGVGTDKARIFAAAGALHILGSAMGSPRPHRPSDLFFH
ncbi:TetR/AcrR family transcriptional regulator [Spongiactinospora sp. 9N601]|uniref:TetR/AcrR family transcriptional regulator n=1 Tax=Spongiactinospora sp. 9N601 TaxID=3375149 RepID=UPI0037A9FD55